MTKESAAELMGKLLISLLFGFVVRPLAIIYGLNLLLSSINITTLPYTLLVYFGVLVIALAINVKVVGNE